MEPRIEQLPQKKLVGKRIRTAQAENRTAELWRAFMPRRKEIKNTVGSDLFSVQFFDTSLDPFGPDTPFDKWAAVEVTEFTELPEGMEALVLENGPYAVFVHRGPVSAAPQTFGYIYGTWLPASEYDADNRRAHFAVMGKKYAAESPDSEEEIWIPVQTKG